jgi:aconitate hydratase
MDMTLVIRRSAGSRREVPLLCRIDTPVEFACYRHGGILPYVLRALMTD